MNLMKLLLISQSGEMGAGRQERGHESRKKNTLEMFSCSV